MPSTLFDIPDSRIHRSADISSCGRYRWSLRRSWTFWNSLSERTTTGKGVCCFVMLNPSTADDKQDDPTIRRCVRFARDWGYEALSVRNLFPWRATDPKELIAARIKYAIDITGGHRGETELLTACTADLVVAAWGAGVPFNRDRQALELFARHFPAKPIYCVGKTKHGHPRHPLYVAKAAPLILLNEPTEEAEKR